MESAPTCTTLIVLLYGIPGAGKSSLVQSCIERFTSDIAEGSERLEASSVCLDELLADERASAPATTEWTEESRRLWKAARNKMLLQLRELISARLRASSRSIVFVDDNFQLKSMRKHVFWLARDGNRSFHTDL